MVSLDFPRPYPDPQLFEDKVAFSSPYKNDVFFFPKELFIRADFPKERAKGRLQRATFQPIMTGFHFQCHSPGQKPKAGTAYSIISLLTKRFTVGSTEGFFCLFFKVLCSKLPQVLRAASAAPRPLCCPRLLSPGKNARSAGRFGGRSHVGRLGQWGACTARGGPRRAPAPAVARPAPCNPLRLGLRVRGCPARRL